MSEQLELGGHIQIRVSTAFVSRRLSRNRVHPDKNVISLRLSYHQFAELITNLNNSSGTPCTLEWITPAGEGEVESYSPPPTPKTEFESELKSSLAEALKSLEELKAAIEDLTTKGKAGKGDLAQLKHKVDEVNRRLISDTVWIENSFQEAMADTVSRSKIEASAWLDEQMRTLGLQAIMQNNQILELEESNDTDRSES